MKTFSNFFKNGIQNDLDYAVTPNDSYLEAHNLTLTGDSKFFSLENIKGTQELETLITSFTGYVMAVYGNKYKIGATEGVDCLTVFTAEDDTFKIIAYDLENDVKYELFEDTYTGYEAANPLIDAVNYPENGLDIIYFTDNFNEIRKLRCEIPSPYSANFLTPSELSLQRRGTIAALSLDSIPTTGGSLLCGSYQFALRFYNEDSKVYTKWTIPSSPINISQVTSDVGYGSYNAVSSKYIRLRVDVPDEEYTLYTHYQFAVIENTQAINGVNASLLKLETPSVGSVSGGFTTFYHDYKSNVRIDFVPIEDIVVDLAAIDHVKTLQVKNNKLFAANITYTNLEYDNGDPTVNGSITRVTVDPVNDFHTSTRKGMWRDEVYRYYISYYNSRGDYSRPKVLDMSTVTGNQISNGDLKTPSKKTAGFTLLDGSSNLTSLTLSLTIDNHPSWARGFVILRAKRKARIKFQTPFVPSCLIEGVEVLGVYPTSYKSWVSGSEETTSVSNASPMNPVGTHLPKNYMFPVRRDYVQTAENNNSTKTRKGELVINSVSGTTSSNKVYFTYGPNVYVTGQTTKPYIFTDGDKFETVDYAFLKLHYTSFQDNSEETDKGNYLDTSVHGTFYATSIGDYYYSNSITRSDPTSPPTAIQSGKIVNYKDISNLGEGTQVGGNSVCEFNNLTTTGISFNPSPSNQATGVVQLDIDKLDSAYYGTAGGLTTSSGASVNSGFYELTAATQSNTFTPNKAGFVEASSYVSIVDIVNIVTEQSNDRYGDVEDIHDMVFTGASYAFNASQVTAIESTGAAPVTLSIAGGDCYVSVHQFKLTDSHYGLVNVEKNGDGTVVDQPSLSVRWEKLFVNGYGGSTTDGARVASLPVPYRNVSQVLAVVMESEINGAIQSPRVYPLTGTLQDESTNEYNLRTPFPYIYNFNYSKESTQKAFIPFDPDETITTRFKARGVYSDQKIYNTFTDGFDIFRTASTFDLEETYGGITKLILSGDELYAIQEKAVAYLPVDAQMAETTDGTVLSLRSSTTVDIPRYVSRQYGCQHMKGVSQIDSAVFFPDNINKAVLRFEAGKLELISETGMIKNFNTMFADQIAEPYISSLYDNKRRQYWLSSREPGNIYTWIWDDRLKCWVSNYEFVDLMGGVYTKDEVYIAGLEIDGGGNYHLHVYKMYAGFYNILMGTTVTPRVRISVNPEFEYAKTFDDVVVFSSAVLASCNGITETDSGENQSVSGMVFALKREGNYRIATLRDSNNARLRGLRAIFQFNWGTSDSKTSFHEVVTKYRTSQRMI